MTRGKILEIIKSLGYTVGNDGSGKWYSATKDGVTIEGKTPMTVLKKIKGLNPLHSK